MREHMFNQGLKQIATTLQCMCLPPVLLSAPVFLERCGHVSRSLDSGLVQAPHAQRASVCKALPTYSMCCNMFQFSLMLGMQFFMPCWLDVNKCFLKGCLRVAGVLC